MRGKRKSDSMKLLISILILATVLIAGCIQQRDCTLDDCEDIPHVACIGKWEVSGTHPNCNCNWVCETVEEETQNVSVNYSEYCEDSVKKYVDTIENISNITIVKIDTFDVNTNATDYVRRNWSSVFYDIVGIQKDVTDITVVTIVNLTTNRNRKFTLPILCDENGKIGNYSSCLLDNIPDIPSACHNLTVNLTECEIEILEHPILEDIQYWVEPPGGALLIGLARLENKTEQLFNFTIRSSRNRIESFGMVIHERTFSPLNDRQLVSLTKLSSDGSGGSATYTVNVTNKTSVEFYASTWFKKKCYDKQFL